MPLSVHNYYSVCHCCVEIKKERRDVVHFNNKVPHMTEDIEKRIQGDLIAPNNQMLQLQDVLGVGVSRPMKTRSFR